MKILYSHRTKSADGQHVHIDALTRALTARGHEIVMAGPESSDGPARKKLDADAGSGGVREWLPRPVHELAEFAYSAPAYLRLAARAAGADVLYERYNLFYHSGVRLARARKLPFILEVNAPLAEERARHGGLAFPALARWSEQSIWRAADMVLPVTGVLGRIIEAAGVPAEKIHVIQNGVDADFLVDVDPRPVRAHYGLEDKVVLGFTGFVRSWHRVDRVIRYLSESGHKDLHLLLVGEGTARADLEREARALGVVDQVTITGIVQRNAVPSHVAAFDIALQPAVVPYASPLKLFEYMALGKAILAPVSDNIREVLTDGQDAFLFSGESNDAFAAGLEALVSDAALREKLGVAARASLLRQDLTWAANAERVEMIAERLLERV